MGLAVIELESVWLRYRLGKRRLPSFKDYALHWLRGALEYQSLWALRDVSLRVEQGGSLGVIGRNGAGKSTLLKVVSGILRPTRGRTSCHGSVAPMLELGIGFDFELTGLENIYLSGLLLGHSRRAIDTKLESILEFSGLHDFIHSPVRSYSSGMLARLGFSILTAWKPDVLLLDEFMAVGDTHFVKRCKERTAELRSAGTTLVLVSHVPTSIESCDRCIWIEAGRVRAEGRPEDVLGLYERSAGASVVPASGLTQGPEEGAGVAPVGAQPPPETPR